MTSAAEANDRLEDLSGIVLQPGENPYLALIRACHDNAVRPSLPPPPLSFILYIYISL